MSFEMLSLTANVIQITSLLWMLGLMLWERRPISIVVRNLDGGARLIVARLQARHVTRAEILGIVGQYGHGDRLDFSGWRFHRQFRDEVVVDLPAASYTAVAQVLAEASPI